MVEKSLPVPEPGDVWYYAFGSNMNPTVLTGRRKVQPKASVPAILDGWVLGFNMRAIPYVEPGMATILPYTASDKARAKQAGVGPAPKGVNGRPIIITAKAAHEARCAAGLHGVLHLISAKDWEIVKATEGVRLQGLGYQVVKVTCDLYNGAGRIDALTLVGAPFSVADPATILPSQRYISLIREGARIHGVDPAYCAMLEAHPAFEPPNDWGQYLGRWIMDATKYALVAPLMPLIGASSLGSVVQRWRGKPEPPSVTPGATASRLPAAPTTTTVVAHANGTAQANGENGAAPPSDAGAAVMTTKLKPAELKHEETKPPPGIALIMMVRTHLGANVASVFMQITFRLSHVIAWLISPVLGSGVDNSPRWKLGTASADKKNS